MNEYINTYVMDRGKAYRAAFHRSGRVMIVCRKTKRDETPLHLDGPTAKRVAKAAWAQISRSALATPSNTPDKG